MVVMDFSLGLRKELQKKNYKKTADTKNVKKITNLVLLNALGTS